LWRKVRGWLPVGKLSRSNAEKGLLSLDNESVFFGRMTTILFGDFGSSSSEETTLFK
jgi:hypothetical protein